MRTDAGAAAGRPSAAVTAATAVPRGSAFTAGRAYPGPTMRRNMTKQTTAMIAAMTGTPAPMTPSAARTRPTTRHHGRRAAGDDEPVGALLALAAGRDAAGAAPRFEVGHRRSLPCVAGDAAVALARGLRRPADRRRSAGEARVSGREVVPPVA